MRICHFGGRSCSPKKEAAMRSRTRQSRPALRWLAASAGLATALYLTNAGFTWLRYGHPPRPSRNEADSLLDQFIPAYEVVERHSLPVAAPSEVTLAAECEMDLMQSAIIRAIFKGRKMFLGGHPDNVRHPRINERLLNGKRRSCARFVRRTGGTDFRYAKTASLSRCVILVYEAYGIAG